MSSISSEFLAGIPKTDLHVHLDGSLRLSTLIELAKEAGVELPESDEAGLRSTVFKPAYRNLPEYLQGFAYTVAVLQTPESLERVAYELAQDNLAEGVRYLEVRYAPQLHLSSGMTIGDTVEAVTRGLDRARREHGTAIEGTDDIPFHFGVILCALRSFVPQMSPYYASLLDVLWHVPRTQVYAVASLELARAARDLVRRGLPVVGFDLAGEEAGYPAADHQEAFQFAHSRFLKKTIHAGEAYGPQSIFQAITDCYANRIGHGTFLFDANLITTAKAEEAEYYVRQLVEYMASQRIHIEVCLTSNLQTIPSIQSVARHPLRQMLEHKLSASICTDNRLVSNTTVTRELELAVSELDITPPQLKNLITAGFKGSFFPGEYSEKRVFVRQAMDRYEALAREHGVSQGR